MGKGLEKPEARTLRTGALRCVHCSGVKATDGGTRRGMDGQFCKLLRGKLLSRGGATASRGWWEGEGERGTRDKRQEAGEK